MIRRIGYAGAGLCAFLLPACVSNWNPTDPYWANANTGVPVGYYQQSRLPGTTVVPGQPQVAGVPNSRNVSGPLPMVQTGGKGLVDAPIVGVATQPDELPKELVKQKDPALNRPDPPKSSAQPATVPTNDDVVIRPKWPNLGGETPVETSSSAKAYENLVLDPPDEKHILPSRNDRVLPPNPKSLPALDVPQLSTTPQGQPEFRATRTSVPMPIPTQPAGEPVVMQTSGANETVLINALRAFRTTGPMRRLRCCADSIRATRMYCCI